MKKILMTILMVLFVSGLCHAETLIDTSFDTGTDGFLFRTDVYGNEASIDRTVGSYENSSGRLHTYLGKGKRGGVGTLAAGWINNFQTTVKSDITITLTYQHRLSGKAEKNEFSEVMCVIDNVMYFPDNQTFVSRFFGDGNRPTTHMDTGVITALIHLTVEPGIHSLGLGFYLNQATAKDEWAEVYFSSIVVEREDHVPPVVDDENKKLIMGNETSTSAGFRKEVVLYNIDEGETFSFSMNVVDKDDLMNVQSPTIRDIPEGSTFTSNVFTWTPGPDQSGYYYLLFEFGSGENFIYKRVDMYIADAKITLKVGNRFEKLMDAVDPDGDDWEMSGVNLPAGATLVSEKQFGPKLFGWTPTLSQVGVHNFTVETTDFPRDTNGDVQPDLQLTDVRYFTVTVVQ